MEPYRHHVSGFFANRRDAHSAQAALVLRGLPRERLLVLEAGSAPAADGPQTQSDNVLDDMLVKGAIGTAVGTGVGALAELALVAANVSLFVASPLIAPLVMMGWGASLGGFIGAAAGAGSDAGTRQGNFSALIRDAIASGQVVLMVETQTEQETGIARDVIQTAVGTVEELDTA
jgi:hypothetical protein